jgi:membrane protein implicated in regulation of membrane protease activity
MAAFWVPLIWLLLAVVLLILELVQPSFDGLMFAALAALLLSLLTALASVPIGIQIGLFVLFTVIGTVWLSRWSARRNPRPGQARQREDLAEVITPFPAGGEGRVRWHGQSWAASSLDLDRPIALGDHVVVAGRDGNRLQVMARLPRPSDP